MFMDDEQLRQLDIRRARYSQQEQIERYSQQEQIDLLREYVELRLLLDDPYMTMKVYVLEPHCEYCFFGRMPIEDGDPLISSAVLIYGHRDNCYMYPAWDSGNLYAADYGRVIRDVDGHDIACVQCEEDLSEETLVYVRERCFQDYLCLQDQSHGLPKRLRRHILDCYGRTCFSCDDPLTASTLSIDHITPQSKGGDSRPTNLQPVCVPCNTARKKDAAPETAHIFLDFLTRPAASDAYSDLIW
jgi:5-methylcytosine-specific restriction endonuclease McrA